MLGRGRRDTETALGESLLPLLSSTMNIFRIFRQQTHPYSVKTGNDDFFFRGGERGVVESNIMSVEKKEWKANKTSDKKCVEEVKERGGRLERETLLGWSDGFSN